MKVRARMSMALALAMAVTGCAALPGGGPPPVDAFELSTPPVNAAGRRLARVQLLIPEPTAIKALDGQDIVVRTGSGTLQYLDGVRWADRLPSILQARLIDMYQQSSRFGGVGKPGEGLAIDYQILVDIRRFGMQVDGANQAEVELFVRLLNDRTGVVRASRGFTASVPASGQGGAAFAQALDRAFAASVSDIVSWTASAI